MNLLPDWAPNIHPLIIHFPIALISLAILLDLLSLILKQHNWLKTTSLTLYTFGAISTVTAYISGKQAAGSVNVPSDAYPVLNHHADLALITMIFFLIYVTLRLIIIKKEFSQKMPVRIALFLIGIIGFYYVVETAEHGAQLVFMYGLGTKEAIASQSKNEQAISGFSQKEDSSWEWQAGENATQDFKDNFSILKGTFGDLTFDYEDSILTIAVPREKSFYFVAGDNISETELSTDVNLDNFNGRFLLVCNLNTIDNYNFFAVEASKGRLGQVKSGEISFRDEDDFDAAGWLNLKTIGGDDHYRGLINNNLVVHGHGRNLPAGRAGIFFMGTGKILIKNIKAVSISE